MARQGTDQTETNHHFCIPTSLFPCLSDLPSHLAHPNSHWLHLGRPTLGSGRATLWPCRREDHDFLFPHPRAWHRHRHRHRRQTSPAFACYSSAIASFTRFGPPSLPYSNPPFYFLFFYPPPSLPRRDSSTKASSPLPPEPRNWVLASLLILHHRGFGVVRCKTPSPEPWPVRRQPRPGRRNPRVP